MLSFDGNTLSPVYVIALVLAAIAASALTGILSDAGWRGRAARDLDLVDKLEKRAVSTSDRAVVETLRAGVFSDVEKSINRSRRLLGMATKVFLYSPRTVSYSLTAMVYFIILAVVGADLDVTSLFALIVATTGVGLDLLSNVLVGPLRRLREWKDRKSAQRKDRSYEDPRNEKDGDEDQNTTHD